MAHIVVGIAMAATLDPECEEALLLAVVPVALPARAVHPLEEQNQTDVVSPHLLVVFARLKSFVILTARLQVKMDFVYCLNVAPMQLDLEAKVSKDPLADVAEEYCQFAFVRFQ